MTTQAAARRISVALAIAAGLLLCARPAQAQIALDAATNGGEVTDTSITFAHTTSGSNRFLLVGIVGDYVPTDDVTGCTYNGVAMTKSVTISVTSDRYAYAFTLMGPASGTNNVVCSASSSHYLAASAVSYTGVSQSGQPEVTDSDTCDACDTLATNITTVTSGSWVAGVVKMGSGGGSSSGTTTRVSAAGDTYLLVDKDGGITPAGAVTLDVGFSTANAAGAAVAFAPVGGGGGSSLGGVTLRGAGR